MPAATGPRPPALDEPYAPPPGDPACVHEDAALLVLVKPAGLLCAPGRGDDKQDCLVSRARRHWPDALLVHRLDLATSGLVLLARSPAVHAALSAAFRERQVAKAYEAVVHGPLPGDSARRPLQKVCHDTGKPSLTRWRRRAGEGGREGNEDAERVALEPVTGRSHQLRVHLAAIGCPIVGDPLYGRPGDPAPRLMLHATRLAFRHPVTGEVLELASPAPF